MSQKVVYVGSAAESRDLEDRSVAGYNNAMRTERAQHIADMLDLADVYVGKTMARRDFEDSRKVIIENQLTTEGLELVALQATGGHPIKVKETF